MAWVGAGEIKDKVHTEPILLIGKITKDLFMKGIMLNKHSGKSGFFIARKEAHQPQESFSFMLVRENGTKTYWLG